MINALAWCGWLIAALMALSATRNPTYLMIAFLCVTLVRTSLADRDEARRVPGSSLFFCLVVIITATFFNGLTSHFGNTVLLVIPGQIPLISGAITLEALVYGALNGLVLSGLFMAFSVLNKALPTRDLIQLIPRAYYSLAIVISIAVTFIPSTRLQFEAIREAALIRGHRFRELRDILPMMMLLLTSGLERAFQLAESMTARGFAGQEKTKDLYFSRLLMFVGLLAMLVGWLLRLIQGEVLPGALILAAGCLLIIGNITYVGCTFKRTTYRKRSWSLRDGWVLAGAALTLAACVIPHFLSLSGYLEYSTYPTVALPLFDPWVGAAILGLLVPIFVII
jgi:energy-coupling factor transport system permease protein